jgi:uncharacterized protein (DUF1800 family)
MVLFWHNHFALQFLEIPDSRACYVYTKVLYTHAMGNFKDLTRAITIDPAMLFYLNGRLNTKKAPDENYARELQELFTLGKGPNSKFTEDDVKAMAKVLTGWSINPLTNPFSTAFVSVNHDSTDKQFSSFYGNTVIKGQTGINAGNTELDELLTMIFKVDEVALFICRKLYEYFVYYEIDDTVETNVIVPLAKVFRDSGYSIKTVLKTLLMSEHFFDTWNRACVIKDPITQQAGFCREMELKFPSSTDHFLLYQMYQMAQMAAPFGYANPYMSQFSPFPFMGPPQQLPDDQQSMRSYHYFDDTRSEKKLNLTAHQRAESLAGDFKHEPVEHKINNINGKFYFL